MKRHYLLLEAFIVVVMMGSFSLGMFVSYAITYNEIGSKFNRANINLSQDIFAFSEKINNEVNGFFNYNLSNLNKTLTDDKLKTEGGVCWHYADYYIDHTLNQTGFYVQKVIINVDESSAHSFAVISNRYGYCILDQTERWCFPFEQVT